MRKSQEIKQEITAVVTDAGKLVNLCKTENRGFTAEEREQHNAKMSRVDDLKSELDTAERCEKQASLEAELRHSERKVSPVEMRTAGEFGENAWMDSVRAWLLQGTQWADNSPDAAYRGSAVGIPLNNKTISVRAISKSTSDTPKAGYTVPQGFGPDLNRFLKYFCPIRQFVRTIQTPHGRDMPWPSVDDTANSASIVAENGTITDATDPSFGSVTMKAFKYPSVICRVSHELLRDSDFDIGALLSELLGERIGRGQEAAFCGTGAGSTAPEGIVHFAASSGVTMDVSDGLSYANLVDVFYSVDIAYRNSPGCAWLMSDLMAAKIRKLVDTTNRPLWEFSMQAGQPDLVLGKPVVISNTLADPVATPPVKPLLFGDLRQYAVRDVSDFTFTRLDELYATAGQVGFLAIAYGDGRGVGNSAGIKYMTTQA